MDEASPLHHRNQKKELADQKKTKAEAWKQQQKEINETRKALLKAYREEIVLDPKMSVAEAQKVLDEKKRAHRELEREFTRKLKEM
jgi:hypothetical protein